MNEFISKKVQSAENVYQKQKLYIENLAVEGSPDLYEKGLKSFLSKYGTIIDLKILQNRKLTRTTEVLCVRYL